MSVNFLLDHLVIAVNDLPRAIEDYRQLGFQVLVGGRHQHAPTQNALVYFLDGTYLELIEWTAPAPGEKWYERLTRHGEGFVDVAFVPSNIGQAVANAAATGVQYRGPIDGSRVKPTGEHVQWQLAWPALHGLPFLCGDVTPRSLRVPEGEVRVQPNRATGIQSIAIAVDDLQASTQAYRGLLGDEAEVGAEDTSLTDTQGVVVRTLHVGEAALHLVSPVGSINTGLSERLSTLLKTRGEGVYAMSIAGIEPGISAQTVAQFSHGVTLSVADRNLTLLEQITPLSHEG
ncbi:VOC family protein [Pseudomonas sp. RC10]|uniref:VOC family protein n=1 Tax=Pseudomonas bambusae TaxID=3139142 RepID=UPI00313A48B2